MLRTHLKTRSPIGICFIHTFFWWWCRWCCCWIPKINTTDTFHFSWFFFCVCNFQRRRLFQKNAHSFVSQTTKFFFFRFYRYFLLVDCVFLKTYIYMCVYQFNSYSARRLPQILTYYSASRLINEIKHSCAFCTAQSVIHIWYSFFLDELHTHIFAKYTMFAVRIVCRLFRLCYKCEHIVSTQLART